MSLIEQAARRLEQLRQAGADIPGEARSAGSDAPDAIEQIMLARDAVEGARAHDKSEPASAELSGAGGSSRQVSIDLVRLAAAGIVTPNAPRSRVADEFRVVKRPLILNATGKSAVPVKNGNLIMVTSALPGEGKSFTA